MRVPEPSDRPVNEAGGRAARYQKGAGKGRHHDAQSANERLTNSGRLHLLVIPPKPIRVRPRTLLCLSGPLPNRPTRMR
jgi:hypothetical protein